MSRKSGVMYRGKKCTDEQYNQYILVGKAGQIEARLVKGNVES